MSTKKQFKDEAQLNLFEEAHEPFPLKKPTTVLDFVRARFEHGPEMSPEEYKRWIKILINSSLKKLE